MRVIPTKIHGVLDYGVGALVAASPWLLGFARGGAETWVPVAMGVGAIVYSFFTDYEFGVVRRLGMRQHLALDMVDGLVLALSPWLFDFWSEIWAPHLAMGILEIAVASLSEQRPYRAQTAGARA